MSKGMALLTSGLLLFGGCREHKYATAWQVAHEDCVDSGVTELMDNEDFDPENDIALVEDVCGKVVGDLSREYQDTHPDDIPSSVRDEAFDEAFEDCLDKSLLESEYC